jgi:hypothetical protein
MATKRNLESMLIASRGEAAQLRKLLANAIQIGAAAQAHADKLAAQLKAYRMSYLRSANRSSVEATGART